MTIDNTDNRPPAIGAAFVAGAIALLAYALTISRSLGWHDSAELALAAWQLGASHAPGSPLHAFLGHLATKLLATPYMGTTLLSVLAAAATVAVLAYLLIRLTNHRFTGVAAALVYAFSYQVWSVAVITEVYSLGMLFMAIAMLLAWFWAQSNKPAYLFWTCVFYGVALSAYFANILLLPAFAGFICWQSPQRLRDLTLFAGITALAVMLVAAANMLLATVVPPIGEVLPDSLRNILLYMSGAQHEPLQLRGVRFAAGRLWQHGQLFVASLGYIAIPLGVLGCARIFTAQKVYALFIALIFAIYFFYYTFFGPGDYYMMVLPAYFIFSVWIGVGLQEIITRAANPRLRTGLQTMVVLLVAALLLVQLPARRAAAADMQAEQFAATAFAALPNNALAVVGWKEFTPLRYLQEVTHERTDLRIILPARSVRRYAFATIDDYVLFTVDQLCNGPVFTTKALADLHGPYFVDEQDYVSGWTKLSLSAVAADIYCNPRFQEQTNDEE